MHPTASNKVRRLLRQVLLLLLGVQPSRMDVTSLPPLHTQVYISLRTSKYIECQKRNLDSAAAAQERERESYMAREYLYKLIEA